MADIGIRIGAHPGSGISAPVAVFAVSTVYPRPHGPTDFAARKGREAYRAAVRLGR
jgi:hypothetical protein